MVNTEARWSILRSLVNLFVGQSDWSILRSSGLKVGQAVCEDSLRALEDILGFFRAVTFSDDIWSGRMTGGVPLGSGGVRLVGSGGRPDM